MSPHLVLLALKRWRKALIACATLFAIVMLLLACWAWTAQRGVHKLLMPGNYSIYLPAGVYEVRYFWRWPSKGLNEPQRHIGIKISDIEGKPIAPLQYPPPSPPQALGWNTGRTEFTLELIKKGLYHFSCDERAVIAIIPSESLYDGPLNEDEFPGSHDDFNFDEPSPSR